MVFLPVGWLVEQVALGCAQQRGLELELELEP